jgi:hypothetical protein
MNKSVSQGVGSPKDHSNADDIVAYLRSRGLLSQKEICKGLSISQSTFSRAIQEVIGGDVLLFGRARKTVYGAKRAITDVGHKIGILLIDRDGKARNHGYLYSIFPSGFVWQVEDSNVREVFKDLPYFLDDLRPQGFLGRIIPRVHSDLGYPPDIRHWSGDHTLGYLIRYGFDTTGQVLLGERAIILYEQSKAAALQNKISKSQRPAKYSLLAVETLEKGTPGSSAAGEQPKFTCHLEIPTKKNRGKKQSAITSVLVKFSPRTDETVGRRVGDLLISECLAHQLLKQEKISVPDSTIHEFKDQIFLEVERFDRTLAGGRRGVISLNALNMEFIANTGSWTDVGDELAQKKIILSSTFETICKLDLFGELIANTDRHHGNLSFFFDDLNVGELTPVYDMLPMLYMPQQGQVLERVYLPQPPKTSQLPHWDWAKKLALQYWDLIAADPRISKGFQKIATENRKKLAALMA